MDGTPAAQRLPLVAIGASAGGLDPLEAFFNAAPVDAGWCFVVVQHLSPDYRSMMDELLARQSRLAIRHIEDGMTLAENTIFLNPPNTLVELDGEAFALTPYNENDNAPHLPIDAFFYSMAARGARRSVAVVLSGAGADGARGAAEVQRAGGLVFVQTPKSAKFSSMPRAVLAAGAVDRVLEAADMPDAIAAIFRNPAAGDQPDEAPRDAGGAILHLLQRAHHLDFSAYKAPTVLRRIERRQQLKGLPTLEAYRDLLAADPDALEELYHDLLIGVTEFYRDPDAMAALGRQALTPLVAKSQPGDELRIWVPACASGEEAYTIAIELSETIRRAQTDLRFRIIATDVHRPSVDRAAAGVYPESAVAKLPDSLRSRYFIEHRQGVVVDPAVRQKVVFSVQDVLRDPPFMRLDLISCRNLLIYLNEDAQARVISTFLFGLRKDSYLFLGSSESLGRYQEDFTAVESKWRLYRKSTDRRMVDQAMLASRLGPYFSGERRGESRRPSRPPLSSVDHDQSQRRDRDSLLRGYDALLKRYAPSSILITTEGTVLTWFGAASAYIDTMSNLAEWTVEAIIHPDLQYPINVGVERVRRGQNSIYERQVTVTREEGTPDNLTVRIEPLGGRGDGARFLLVGLTRADEASAGAVTAEGTEPGDSGEDDRALVSARIRELERDLRLTEESLQYVTERLEASGEELQASNEELQASNEELQASNEELQSSNEELQAVNEELISLGAEHERKIELLSELNGDMELVFDLMQIGVLILDEAQQIRRFTRMCSLLLALEDQDVGRHVSNVGARPQFVDINAMARRAAESRHTEKAVGEFGEGELTIQAMPFRNRSEAGGQGTLLLFFGSALALAEQGHTGTQQ